MDSGLMLCDIGNSALKIGFAAEGRPMSVYRFPTNPHDTPDSLGLRLAGAARHAGMEKIAACAAASVVPASDNAFREAAAKYLGCETLFASKELPVPLKNAYKRPQETGADILVGAWAARQALPEAASLIVVDFGTAATFACVSGDSFLGGLIFPGPATAAAALARGTAKLPHVSPETTRLEPRPCEDTVASIQDGLVFGFASLAEGLCARLARQLPKPVKVAATGGFAKTLEPLTTIFDAVLPNLILDGLLALYKQAGAERAQK